MDFSYYNKAVKGQDKRAKLALDSLISNSYEMVKGCKGKIAWQIGQGIRQSKKDP